jgi:3,4-dehydroadipyl-CoA semialdehyde dehydrogenase
MQVLGSYIGGGWLTGSGATIELVNPTTEATLAVVHRDGHDLAAAFAHARGAGRRELGAMTFAQRGALLASLAKAIHGAREELIALAVANGGNTRGDAKFDLDGASATLAYYGELAATLPEGRLLLDGDAVQLGRTARMGGQHVWLTCPGVAVHINAFNFPAWGLAEKAACALLAGMPVIAKPATATALVAHRVVELWAPLLPPGALQLLVGPPQGLLDHVGPGDVVAFTGGSATAQALRAHPRVIAHSVRLNVEADSLNAAVLGPDVELGSETLGLLVADVTRDMTQKTGQKCTATRRVLVPRERAGDVAAAFRDRLGGIVVGDPSRDDVRMGPLATATQLRDARAGIAALAAETTEVFGGSGEVTPLGVPAGKGYFVGPVVRATDAPLTCAALHAREIFGPVVTIGTYDGAAATAAAFIGKGEGCLVSSAYSNDRGWLQDLVIETAPWLGRLYIGSDKMAAQSPGPGTVLPQLVHGGPGRAGGGEELGGVRGLHHYMQRTALEGDTSLLKALR